MLLKIDICPPSVAQAAVSQPSRGVHFMARCVELVLIVIDSVPSIEPNANKY